MTQAAQIATEYYMGQGMVFIGTKDATTGEPQGLRHLGNVTSLATTLKTSVIELKEAMTGTRGTAKRLTTEVGAGFSATLESLNKENLAIALRGEATDVAGSTVVKATYKVFKGSVVKLAHIGISSVSVYDGATGLTAYTVTEDYTVNSNNISIPLTGDIATADSGTGVDVQISYTYAAQEKIEAFTVGEKEYYVYFEGLNTADENKAVVVEIYKVAMDPLKELALINDKQAEIVFEGSCLLDSTRATGSKYFTVKKI
ncbi:MAG TPA: hypothetical protein DCZ63_14795 [Geobacter sp.]|nr:hypothetical protein [Geobacter sp.]